MWSNNKIMYKYSNNILLACIDCVTVHFKSPGSDAIGRCEPRKLAGLQNHLREHGVHTDRR